VVVAVETSAAVCDDKDRGGSGGAARLLLAPRAKLTWFRSKFIGRPLLGPPMRTAASSVRRRFEKIIGGGSGGGSESVSTSRSGLTCG